MDEVKARAERVIAEHSAVPWNPQHRLGHCGICLLARDVLELLDQLEDKDLAEQGLADWKPGEWVEKNPLQERVEKAEAERDEARATKDMHKERYQQSEAENARLREALYKATRQAEDATLPASLKIL